jgi:mRNA interferase MazF
LRHGEIWWADFGKPVGSEPSYRRPVLVVQADPFNQSKIATVVVVALTKNLHLAAAPGNLLCDARLTGLRVRCVANVSQLLVVNRSRLIERVGAVPGALMKRVEDGMRLVLGLA